MNITKADFEADDLLKKAGIISGNTAIDSGNYIIILAERIKAERSSSLLERYHKPLYFFNNHNGGGGSEYKPINNGSSEIKTVKQKEKIEKELELPEGSLVLTEYICGIKPPNEKD